MINIIAAVAKNNVIGAGGHLPWSIKEDMDYFHKVTQNSVLIMGRVTFEEINRNLPNRKIIVVTAKNDVSVDDVLCCTTLTDALELAKNLLESCDWDNIFICGGQEIFKDSLSFVDRLYITRINKYFDGDRYFPDISESCFKLSASQVIKTKDNIEIFFNIYDKI